jgi:hypothetical protein
MFPDVVLTAYVPIIPGLFDKIYEGVNNGVNGAEIPYDEVYGYPKHIWIDEIAGTALDSSLQAFEQQVAILEQKAGMKQGSLGPICDGSGIGILIINSHLLLRLGRL